MMLFTFSSHMLIMSASCATWITTAEVFMTHIQTTGHGTANTVSKISGYFGPFLFQQQHMTTTTDNGDSEAPASYTVIGWVVLLVSITTVMFSCMLPETKGKNMGEEQRHTANGNAFTTIRQHQNPRHPSCETAAAGVVMNGTNTTSLYHHQQQHLSPERRNIPLVS